VQIEAFGANTYQWNENISLSDYYISNPIASPTQTTIYTVKGENIYGCQETSQALVNVTPLPITEIIGTSKVCVGKEVNLYASGGTTYSWSTGDTQANISFYPDSTQWIYCVASTTCKGIPDSLLVEVVQDYPIADFIATPDTFFWPHEVYFQNLSTNADKFHWNFGINVLPSTQENPTQMYARAGYFPVILIAYNDAGCRDTIVKYVLAENVFLWVPSAFTPNDDSHNEFFKVGYYGIRSLHIDIFDRWGTIVFSSDDKDFLWDGRFKGLDCPEGVFTYRIEAIGENELEYPKIGTVTLIR
jgi:gliding motility-associated-like protein